MSTIDRTDALIDTMTALAGRDPATLDRDDLSAGLRELKRVRGWLDATTMAYTRRLQTLASHDHDRSTTQSLINDAGQSTRDAQATEDRASLCDRFGDLEDSLADGEITAAHLDVITRCTRNLDEAERSDFDQRVDEVHGWARRDSVEMFERRVKQLVKQIRADHTPSCAADELTKQRDQSKMSSWVDSSTGMHKFMWELDPIRASKFYTAHQHAISRLRARTKNSKQPYGSLQVDALLNAITGDRDRGSSRVPEIVVLVDDTTLLTGVHDDRSVCETIDGSPIPIGLVRQMMCDATITLTATNADGVVRDTITARTASTKQRTELAAMYATCAFPNCNTPVTSTRAHHVQFHRNGGTTTVPNLLPVCEQHHHSIHDAGWTVTLNPTTRTATWTPPHDGPTITTRPNRRPPRNNRDGSDQDDDGDAGNPNAA